MAKSSKRKATVKAARPRKRAARARAPEAGPVTLAQARALAQGPRPRRAPRRALVAAASPGTVGAERKKLALKQREEIARRIEEYKATLTIMKKRGVKGLGTAAGPSAKRRAPGAKAAPKAPATKPLQVFAEGDSWFDYPAPFFGGSIVPRLEKHLGVPILNLAKAGDEVRYMLGVAERKLLTAQLKKGCPAGGPWDVLLFSGGGNDIVDNPMALWIKDFDPSIPPTKPERHIFQTRFDAVLALVRAGYEDLIGLRDELSPTTHLVFHAYDFAIPDGRGICHLGPWLKPTLDLRKFPPAAAAAVVKAMLEQFAAVLASLEDPQRKTTVIKSQGTLVPQASSWHNELHPSKKGFDAFAVLFHASLKALFPGRVL